MLHVHHAGRAERLVDVLAELLAEPADDPFATEVVAVPSRAVQRWVEQQLARRLGTSPGGSDGIATDIEFPFPGRLLRPRPDRIDPTSPGGRAALISNAAPHVDPWQPGALTWQVLHHGRAERPALGYAQAHHAARLFDRYAVYRPALLHLWAAGRDTDADGHPLDAAQLWQPRWWRAVAASLAERTTDPAERLRTAVGELTADPSRADLPARFVVLALGGLPASSLVVLDALAAHREVHLLLLHPSPGWWSHVATVSLPDGLAPQPRVEVPAQHPLLAAWGQVAVESQLGLRAAPDGRERVLRWHLLDAVERDREPATLLERLQHDIRLDRDPAAAPTPVPSGDRSVQVHACHGLTRQVEVLRDAIAHVLQDSPDLLPSDVVVLCTDLDRARPIVRSVMGLLPEGHGGGAPRFPLVMADAVGSASGAPGHVDDPMVDALLTALRTARGRGTASSIGALAALAPVRRRLGFTDTDIARIDTWIEQANVRWGLDAAHLHDHGLPAELDITTWEAALDRLLLGLAMRPDDDRLAVGDRRPCDAVGLDDAGGIGRLAHLVHLLRGVRAGLAERRPASAWTSLLRGLADTLLAADPTEPWQERRLARLLDTLDADRDAAGNLDPELGIDDVLAALQVAWAGGGGGANWGAGGITVCPLGELRGVPFRVVCVLGLDDTALRSGGAHPDDLLARQPRIGDRDPRSEQRSVLLDALMAARQHLVITHDGHDVRTNQPLPPAVALAELLDVVDRTTGDDPGTAVERLVVHHPRQGFAEAALTPGSLGVAGPWAFDPDALAGALARRAGGAPPAALHELVLARPTSTDMANGQTVALTDLLAALTEPALWFLDRGLGLRLPRTPDERVDLIPTKLDALRRWQLAQRLLDLRARPGVSRDEADDIWVRLARADGLLPPGAFADLAIERARSGVDALHDLLTAEGLPLKGTDTVEIDVALADGRRLLGTVGDLAGSTLVRCRSGDVRAKDLLPARVAVLALAAAGHPADAFLGGTADTTAICERVTERVERDDAVAALTGLVDLAERCTRSALPLPVGLGASWAGAFRDPSRKPKSAADAWRNDLYGAATELIFGHLTDAQMAELRARDDGTPAPTLARQLWQLLEGRRP